MQDLPVVEMMQDPIGHHQVVALLVNRNVATDHALRESPMAGRLLFWVFDIRGIGGEAMVYDVAKVLGDRTDAATDVQHSLTVTRLCVFRDVFLLSIPFVPEQLRDF